MKTCLICIKYSSKHPASQFLTLSHWLRSKTSENWKALDKKNIKANKCRKRKRKKGPLSEAVWGHSCPRAGGGLKGLHRFPEKERT